MQKRERSANKRKPEIIVHDLEDETLSENSSAEVSNASAFANLGSKRIMMMPGSAYKNSLPERQQQQQPE